MDLDRLIEGICDEYVARWKTEGRRYISVPSLKQVYAEVSMTLAEGGSLLIVKLRELSKVDSQVPPAIPMLPLQVLRRLATYPTKPLEVQVSPDHYEYWARSAKSSRTLRTTPPY